MSFLFPSVPKIRQTHLFGTRRRPKEKSELFTFAKEVHFNRDKDIKLIMPRLMTNFLEQILVYVSEVHV